MNGLLGWLAEHVRAAETEQQAAWWTGLQSRAQDVTAALENRRPWSVQDSIRFAESVTVLARSPDEGGAGQRWHAELAEAVKAARPYAAVQANLGLILARLEPESPLAVADLAGLGLAVPPARQLARTEEELPLVPEDPPRWSTANPADDHQGWEPEQEEQGR